MLLYWVAWYGQAPHDSGVRTTNKLVEKKSARELLALNLRLMRVRKNITQEGLAMAAGVNKNYISQIESRTRAVSIDIVDRLAHALGTSAAALLADE